MAWQASRSTRFADLWLSADQQGRLAFEARDWPKAAERFESRAWSGTAAYYGGLYELAADQFGGSTNVTSYFNRGNALMKAGKYRDAVRAYELAVDADPDFSEARENLDLARYVVEYVERSREQSDTGDESELGADDFTFDNEDNRGRQVEITRESTIALESAEKWMRSVDTDTADFLKTRFRIEAALRNTE
jgi:Ca-activated chloride channel family protein